MAVAGVDLVRAFLVVMAVVPSHSVRPLAVGLRRFMADMVAPLVVRFAVPRLADPSVVLAA